MGVAVAEERLGGSMKAVPPVLVALGTVFAGSELLRANRRHVHGRRARAVGGLARATVFVSHGAALQPPRRASQVLDAVLRVHGIWFVDWCP